MAIYSCRKICALILDHITKYCSTVFFAGKRDEHSWIYIFFTKKKEFRESPPRFLGKILSTFWPPKVSHLRTECTWEHSWEQKKQIRLIALSAVFQKHLVVFWRWQKRMYNCCFLSGSIRLWLSQLFRSQALVETSNVIMMIFVLLKEGLSYGFIIFRLHLPTMVKHLRWKVEHLHTNGDVSKGQTELSPPLFLPVSLRNTDGFVVETLSRRRDQS